MPDFDARHEQAIKRLRKALLASVLIISLLASVGLAFAGKHIAGEQIAYSGPKAAVCTPSKLNVSDVLKGTTLAVSPLPSSRDASPQTQISFLGVPSRDLKRIKVLGSITGLHEGRLKRYSQGDGGSFLPSSPFHPGEHVTVSGEIAKSSRSKRFAFHFTVAYPDPIPPPAPTPTASPPLGSVQTYRSAPALKPPTIEVTKRSPESAEGDIFLAPYSGPGPAGPTIVDPEGSLVWMDPLPGNERATNFQVQSYEGKRVLTWWQGYIPKQGFGLGEEIVANDSYEQILHIKAGNGEPTDLHDFHLEPHHTAVLTIFHTIHCDLTSADGPRDSAVTDASFQEIDVKTGLVRREWTSVDHVKLSESYSSPTKASAQWPFDFFHINTIDPRSSGTALISSRNTSALWLIDTKTGEVIEKIGGKHSTVAMREGAATAFQHDAMSLANGDISIFDNGGTPFGDSFSHQHSRGVVVGVSGHTDTLLREFDHDPPLRAGSQGNVQPLPNGNWFVGWGQEPYFTEYDPAGHIIYEGKMSVPSGFETQSYRTYKFPWRARPHWPPSIATVSEHGALKVYASWNGATEVSAWEVLGGASASDLKQLARVRKQGFETVVKVASEPYVKVVALDSKGNAIGRSPVTKR